MVAQRGYNVYCKRTIRDALSLASTVDIGPCRTRILLVTGSLRLVGNMLAHIIDTQSDP